MNKKITNIATLSALSAVSLTACSTAVNKANNSFNETSNLIKQEMQANELTNGSLYNIDRSGVYVDKTAIDTLSLDEYKKLPSKFNNKVTVNDQTPKDNSELASFLTKVTGIKVVIQPDLLETAPQLTQTIGDGENKGSVINDILYTGTAKGLFDHVTSKLNVNWKWDKDVVEIYKYETKMFSLDALSGVNKLSANLNTTSSSSTGSSSSSEVGGSSENTASSGQQTEINNTINVWEEVGSAIQTVLGPNEKVSLTPSAGKIVVMATPAHMRKVETILKHFNQFYSKLVRLDIKVYQVEVNDEDNYGVNWNAVWRNAQDTANFAVRMGEAITDGTMGVVLSPRHGSGGNRSVSGNAVFDALSTMGKTSILRNNSVVTLNNQSVPLNVAREIAYVQSTSVSTTDVASSTEINPGVVTEGFAMNMTPLVNDKGEILLQYSVDSSTVEAIETFSSADGRSTVQLPRRSVSNFLQKVALRNGESMVLTGFQEVKGAHSDSGVGSSRNWMFGGSRKADSNLKTIVVVITPFIIK